MWEHKSISALQHLCNSGCCVYLCVISHRLSWNTLYTPGRISDSYSCATLLHTQSHKKKKEDMHTHRNYADTHSDTHEVPARRTSPGPSASCLAVTVACCARERGRTRLKRAVTQPTKDHDRVSWWHTHTHTHKQKPTNSPRAGSGLQLSASLCGYQTWLPRCQCKCQPRCQPMCVCVCVCVCICVCKCVFGQGKSDGYNAHTSGVCLIGEQTSRLACLHTAGCNACTVGHTHTHTHTLAHVCRVIQTAT